MKKYFLVFLAMLSAYSSLLALEYDLGGQWVKEGSVEYYDFDPQNPESSDGNLLYFQNDYENRQYVVIDTNKILYRISIDSGKTVLSFKLPNVVEIESSSYENYMYKLGNNDSVFITVKNVRYKSTPSLQIKVYNVFENKILLDTFAYADCAWGAGTTLLSVEFLEHLKSIAISYKVSTQERSNYYRDDTAFLGYVFNYESKIFSRAYLNLFKDVRKSKTNYFFSEADYYYESYGSAYSSETKEYWRVLTDSNLKVVKKIIKGENVVRSNFTSTRSYYGDQKNYGCPGFTSDGNYLILVHDTVELHNVFDSTDIQRFQVHRDGYYAGIFDVPNSENNLFVSIVLTYNKTFFKISLFDRQKGQVIDSCYASLKKDSYVFNMIDSTTICYGKGIKFNLMELLQNKPKIISANRTKTIVNSEILFESYFTGNYATIKWDFGDGTISRESKPKHTYTKPGLYTVQFFIDRFSKIDTIKYLDYIYIYDYPKIKLNCVKNFDIQKMFVNLDIDADKNIWNKMEYEEPANDGAYTRLYRVKNGDSITISIANQFVYDFKINCSSIFGDKYNFTYTMSNSLVRDSIVAKDSLFSFDMNEFNSIHYNGNSFKSYGNDRFSVFTKNEIDTNLNVISNYTSETRDYSESVIYVFNDFIIDSKKDNFTIYDTLYNQIKEYNLPDYPFCFNDSLNKKLYIFYKSIDSTTNQNKIGLCIFNTPAFELADSIIIPINYNFFKVFYHDDLYFDIMIDSSDFTIMKRFDKNLNEISSQTFLVNFFGMNNSHNDNVQYSSKTINDKIFCVNTSSDRIDSLSFPYSEIKSYSLNSKFILFASRVDNSLHIIITDTTMQKFFSYTINNFPYHLHNAFLSETNSLYLFGNVRIAVNGVLRYNYNYILKTIPLTFELDTISSVQEPSPLSSNLLYPNPANNHLSCKLEGAEIGSIEIFNTFGISEMKLENIHSNDYDFSINLSQGFYIVVIKDIYGNTYSEKLIINK